MATLTGKITDVTGRAPDSISSITVKAPSARIGSGTDVIVSSPAEVTFNKTTGDITISGLTGGLSWLYIEGDGWSDSIPLAVAEGMITLVEAIANAAGVPGLTDFIALLTDLQTRIDAIAQGAVDSAIGGTTSYLGRSDTLAANRVLRLNDEGKAIISTASITGPSDPVNKAYADAVVGTTTNIISHSDDRFAGQLVRVNKNGKVAISTASITGPNDPVNKAYADAVVGTTTDHISYSDDRFAGQLVRVNENGKVAISTASITGPSDPVNKQYVDNAILESSGGHTSWWN